MHCNWGWGGQGNGYYLFNVFDMQYLDPHKTRATYNSNISAYVNIFFNRFLKGIQRLT